MTPPSHRGFGTNLIERSVVYELHGEARMDFAERGVRCDIAFPLAGNAASDQPRSAERG